MTASTLNRVRDLYLRWGGFDPFGAGFTPADALDDLRRMRAHYQQEGIEHGKMVRQSS